MTNGSEPIIRVENLTAGYGDVLILEDISFDVQRGRIFAILGGSGCGKSTLLKNMIGLYEPLSGRVLIDGDDILTARGAERHRILRKFGVSYQTGAMFGSMTVHENVRLALEEFTSLPREAMDVISSMKLDLVDLADAGNKMPAELSGGMLKRAAIARAMVLDPDILFLDEPSTGLDPITAAELDQLIVYLAGNLGITFVIVTHDLASTFAVADEVVMLEDRRIVARGDPRELRRRSDDAWISAFFNRRALSASKGPRRTMKGRQPPG